MFKLFSIPLRRKNTTITCVPVRHIRGPRQIFIPSDFSSAAFFIVLGLILKNTALCIKTVNINPSRCGLLPILKRMGATIIFKNRVNSYEPYSDIIVKSSPLKATTVLPHEIPSIIDEIPILSVAASYAKGTTLIRGVKELTIKETNRVASMVTNLSRAGIMINAVPITLNGKSDIALLIKGGGKHKSASLTSFNDHRSAMSAVIFGAAAQEYQTLDTIDSIAKSFPEFITVFESLIR
jgi:3-phosphoshikimate 1-carboxyvinyltransferase